MARRLFDSDAVTGLKTYFDYDEARDSFALTYEQDVTPHLDMCHDARAENKGRMGDVVHAASIPVGVQYEWLVKHGVNMWDKNHRDGVKRLLNGEYRHLKVRNIII